MSMFKTLLLILCFGFATSVFFGCTQPQQAGDEAEVVEEEVVEEVAVPTEAPVATPMDDAAEGGTE